MTILKDRPDAALLVIGMRNNVVTGAETAAVLQVTDFVDLGWGFQAASGRMRVPSGPAK